MSDSNPQSTPPQPNTGDERLRAEIVYILDNYEPGEVRVSEPDGTSHLESTFVVAVDEIMQAVKAELGAARIQELELTLSIVGVTNVHGIPIRNLEGTEKVIDPEMLKQRLAELRNHFGIGEAYGEITN